MGQILHTKDYGDIEVVRSFVKGTLHIVELAGGGYAHASGLPIQNMNELTEAIPPGPYLEKALHWWEHRYDDEVQPKRSIMLRPDGMVTFDDGSLVTSISDIIQHVPPGPFLDAAIAAFTAMQEQSKVTAKAMSGPGGKAVQRMFKRQKASDMAVKAEQEADDAVVKAEREADDA